MGVGVWEGTKQGKMMKRIKPKNGKNKYNVKLPQLSKM